MSDRIAQERDRQRQEQNRYAREVIAGSDVRLSHRPAVPQASTQPGFTVPTISAIGSTTRLAFLVAIAALILISIGVYFFGGFELASVILFVLSLVLMAGWFVF
jgi:hypothetical protein